MFIKVLRFVILLTCTPACTESLGNRQNHVQNLFIDQVGFAAVWPTLPEHIKAAIKALVQTHKKAENQ
jgi:hypothetical protein